MKIEVNLEQIFNEFSVDDEEDKQRIKQLIWSDIINYVRGITVDYVINNKKCLECDDNN